MSVNETTTTVVVEEFEYSEEGLLTKKTTTTTNSTRPNRPERGVPPLHPWGVTTDKFNHYYQPHILNDTGRSSVLPCDNVIPFPTSKRLQGYL